jgi:5-formyltetrahydrofolate cyclo-ligase
MQDLPSPTPEIRARVVQAVAGWLRERRPRVVVGFLAMGDEIDMSPLVEELPEITFALTRTGPGVSLTVHPFSAPRERHRFGFEQPAQGSPRIAPLEVDVVLVPGLAFSGDGRRLGRGAGYYDRFLAGLDADTVALTTSSRMRDDLPCEEHDVLMRWIATEDGVQAVQR